MIDGDGTITAKYFEESLHFRASADQLLRAALGQEVDLPPLPADLDRRPGSNEVSVDVLFDGDVLNAAVVRDLIVRFALPDGHHLYGEPVPEGMVATSVEVDPAPGLVVRDPVFPSTTPHTLAGTGETLHVYEPRPGDGTVIVRIPISQLSRSLVDGGDGSWVQPVEGTIRWQSCDDEVCHLPSTERFAIDVPAIPHNRPEADRDRPDGMDVRTHLIQMMARRTDRSIAEAFVAMAGDEADGSS